METASDICMVWIISSHPAPPPPLPSVMCVKPWSIWKPTTLCTETWQLETCSCRTTTSPKSATSASPRRPPPFRTLPSCPSSGPLQKHSERRWEGGELCRPSSRFSCSQGWTWSSAEDQKWSQNIHYGTVDNNRSGQTTALGPYAAR